MLKFVPYLTRSIFRNRGRSLLTVLGVGVAVFIVVGLGAILNSRTRALASASETTIIVSEKDQYWPAKSKISGDRGWADRIESEEVPGAVMAVPLTIRQNLWATSGGGLVKAVGIDKGTLREVLDVQVDDEQWKEFMSRRNGALLGIDLVNDTALGNKYSWEVGREFGLDFLEDLPVFMAGSFVPRDPTLRKVILLGDTFLQDAANSRGVASQILVTVGHRDDIERVAAAIAELPYPSGLHAESQRQALDQALADLNEMLKYASAVMVAVGIVILIGLANATSMAVRERIREVGTLRAIGFSRRKVLGLITVESLLLALLGGALGCTAAWAIINATDYSISVSGFSFPVVLSPLLFAIAMGASLLVGILGALPAGLSVNRRPIVSALRSVD